MKTLRRSQRKMRVVKILEQTKRMLKILEQTKKVQQKARNQSQLRPKKLRKKSRLMNPPLPVKMARKHSKSLLTR
jgi:hypothetical protein